MAFVFTVETGANVTGSNSYVSIAEADDYFEIDTNFTGTWTAKAVADKQKLLSWATRVLDQKTKWKGSKANTTQSLRWPRSFAYDCDGVLVGSTAIPTGVTQATLELAKYMDTNDLTTGRDSDGLKEIVVDVIELIFQDGDYQTSIPSILNAALCGLGSFGAGGFTSSFAPISKA